MVQKPAEEIRDNVKKLEKNLSFYITKFAFLESSTTNKFTK